MKNMLKPKQKDREFVRKSTDLNQNSTEGWYEVETPKATRRF